MAEIFTCMNETIIRKVLIVCLFIGFWGELRAQEETSGTFPFDKTEFSYHSGMIMPHVPSIDYVTRDYTSALNLRLIHTTRGSREWQQEYSRPLLGLGYHYGSLGNQQVYGKAHSLYGFFEGPFWQWQDHVALHYRMSAGLAYITRTFDARNNLYNIAIGSHLNLHFDLSLLTVIDLGSHYQLTAGTGLTHLSNGKIHSPNKGLNLISGFLGIRYKLYHPVFDEQNRQAGSSYNKNHFSLIWSHGLKDHNRFKPASYYITSLSINYERQYTSITRYGMGWDAFYNPSLKNHQRHSPEKDLYNPALYRMGLHLSHDLLVGDFALTLQLGHYIHNKVFYITNLYNRVGLKYYAPHNLILNVSLKSHNANAEFIEFGVGYQW
jgi:hypothetical protein